MLPKKRAFNLVLEKKISGEERSKKAEFAKSRPKMFIFCLILSLKLVKIRVNEVNDLYRGWQ